MDKLEAAMIAAGISEEYWKRGYHGDRGPSISLEVAYTDVLEIIEKLQQIGIIVVIDGIDKADDWAEISIIQEVISK